MEDCNPDEDGEEDDRRRQHQELMDLIAFQERIEANFSDDLKISERYYDAVKEQDGYYNLYLQLCDSKKDYLSLNIHDSQSAEELIGHKYMKCGQIVAELRQELNVSIIISEIYFSKKKQINLLLEKTLESKYVPEINISEPTEEQEAECMDEIEDIRNLLISVESKMSELEAAFNEEEIDIAENLHMECMNLQDLELMFNKMTLELHNDMELDTSMELGMAKVVNLNFPIIGSVTMEMVLDTNFWYRSLFDRGKE